MSLATPTVEEVRLLVNLGKTDTEVGMHFHRSDNWCFSFRKKHGIASKVKLGGRKHRPDDKTKPALTLEEVEAHAEKIQAGANQFNCMGMKAGAAERMEEFFRTRRYEDMRFKERRT